MAPTIYCFDNFALVDEPGGGRLSFNGQPVGIPRTSLLLLLTLVRNSGRPVNNDQLFQAGWPNEQYGTEVVRKRVNQHILRVRDVLAKWSGLDPRRVIVTENQRGYVFALRVELRDRAEGTANTRTSDLSADVQRSSSVPPDAATVRPSDFASLMLTHSSQYFAKHKFTRTSIEECLANLLTFWIEYVDHAPTTITYASLVMPSCLHGQPSTIYPDYSDKNGIYDTYLLLNKYAQHKLDTRDHRSPYHSLLDGVRPLCLGDRFVLVMRREPRPRRFRPETLDILGPTIYLHNVAQLSKRAHGKYYELTSSLEELFDNIDVVGPGQWESRYHSALHVLRLPKRGDELFTSPAPPAENLESYLSNHQRNGDPTIPAEVFKAVAARALQNGLGLLSLNNLMTSELSERACFYYTTGMPQSDVSAGIVLFSVVPSTREERHALVHDAATLANAYQMFLFHTAHCRFCPDRS